MGDSRYSTPDHTGSGGYGHAGENRGGINTGVAYDVIANSGEYLALNQDLSKYVGDTVEVSGNVGVGADSLAFAHIDTVQVLSTRDMIDPPVKHPRVN